MTAEKGERKLQFLMSQEQALAFARLVETAERGGGDAACRLGDMYREGLGGLRYSPKETHRWYARSAMAGDPNGQNNLGACYEHGLGCTQSYAKAVKWYRLSAAQGLSTAHMNLGYCYLRGHGVPRDHSEALRLFRLAVAGGEDRAAKEVERLEEALGLRGLQIAPEDTAQVPPRSASCCAADQPTHPCAGVRRDAPHPCSLASGVLPPDGPREHLQPSQTAPADVVAIAPQSITQEFDAPGISASTLTGDASHGPERSSVQVIRSIRFLDETQPGRHLGVVGGIQPPPAWEDEDLRRELMDVLSADTGSPADGADGPADEELFPIFAEGGLRPENLVDGVAERYAEYLEQHLTAEE